MAEKKRFELRVSGDQFNVLKRTAQARGFRSVSAYVQAATTKDVRDSPPDQSDREAFVAASIDRLSKEIRNLHTTQQALFAAVDTYAGSGVYATVLGTMPKLNWQNSNYFRDIVFVAQ